MESPCSLVTSCSPTATLLVLQMSTKEKEAELRAMQEKFGVDGATNLLDVMAKTSVRVMFRKASSMSNSAGDQHMLDTRGQRC